MKPPIELTLAGVFRPRSTPPGFAIPVFSDDRQFWVQEVGDAGEVVRFVRCDVDPKSLLHVTTHIESNPWTQRVGEQPIHAFQMLDGHIEVGRRNALAETISEATSELNNPFVSLDVAEFLGDSEREQQAREACERLLQRGEPLPMPVRQSRVMTVAAAGTASVDKYSVVDMLPQNVTRARYASSSVFIALFLVVTIFTAGYYLVFLPSANNKAITSIAILPFQCSDPSREYLSDGISESLISNFMQLSDLRTIDRRSAFQYKGREVDPQQVGRELEVQAVLTGELLQSGDTLTMQVDLVDAKSGSRLWSEKYNRNVGDLVEVQQDISREIVQKLRLNLTGAQQSKLTSRDAGNAEAYQYYLRGRYYWKKRTAENLNAAITEFQQAIDKDQKYALAYVGLADCYLLLEEYAGTPISQSLPRAEAAVRKALGIDDSLAEAHTSLARVHQNSWNWPEAEKEYKTAIALNPKYPTAHHWYSSFLTDVGRLDEALEEIKRAQGLDPLSPIITGNVGYIYFLKGDLASAQKEYGRTIALDPGFAMGYGGLGLLALRQEKHEQAVTELTKAVELSGRFGHALSDLGYAYAVLGDRKNALVILKELEEKLLKQETAAINLAVVYSGLGEKDRVFALLERDFQQHSYELTRLASDPAFNGLRSDPRYVSLLKRMGLR